MSLTITAKMLACYLITFPLFVEWSYGSNLYKRKRWITSRAWTYWSSAKFIESQVDHKANYCLSFWGGSDFGVSSQTSSCILSGRRLDHFWYTLWNCLLSQVSCVWCWHSVSRSRSKGILYNAVFEEFLLLCTWLKIS